MSSINNNNNAFESLHYFREGNECIVKNINFKKLFIEEFRKKSFAINGKTDSDRTSYRIQTSDTKQLADIFSKIFKTTITEEQVIQHEGNPSQLVATGSAPTKNNIKQPNTSNTTNSTFERTQAVSASKSSSQPVSKTTVVTTKPNSNNSFETLNYFKCKLDKSEIYGVKDNDGKFKKAILEKRSKIPFDFQSKTYPKSKIYAFKTNDPAVIATIFTCVFDTEITKEMVIEHTSPGLLDIDAKESQDTLPPPIPADKTKSDAGSLKEKLNCGPILGTASSTPIPDQKISTSNQQESTPTPPDAIVLNSSQYEKLVSLLGAPNWMTNFKTLHLVFQPNK